MASNKWTREETIVALSVYCQVPFNKANNSNRIINEMAPIIGRSTNALKMKIGNFGRFDPELKKRDISGLSNGSKLDEEIWNEYCNDWEKLAYDANVIISRFVNRTKNDDIIIPEGKEVEYSVRKRVNQSFFRQAVLASYEYTCCITGLTQVALLEACHIANWSEDVKNRLNPSNGLCMNSLFHKAYDNMLIGISADYVIHVSEQLKDNSKAGIFIAQFDKQKIQMPSKFYPNKDLLDIHYQKYVANGK